MPQQGNIAQFTSPIDTFQPKSDAARALNSAAFEENRMYHQAGEDYQHAIGAVLGPIAKAADEHDNMADISQGAYTLAAGTTNLQQAWNKLGQTSDLNDTTIQKKFMDGTVQPFLDKFQAGFTTEKGQEWALTRADDLRNHFMVSTSADMNIRAGQAVEKNTIGQVNQLSAGTYKSPSLLDQNMKQLDALYDVAKEHNANFLDAKQVSQIETLRQDAKNELVKNAIKGYADSNNPVEAKKLLESGNYDSFIPKDEQSTLHKYIDNQTDMQVVARHQQTQVAQYQQEVALQKKTSDVMTQLQGQKLDASKIVPDSQLPPQQKADLAKIATMPQSFLTSAGYGPKFSEKVEMLHNGELMDAAAIVKSVKDGELTPAGARMILDATDKMRTPEGLAEANAQRQVLDQMKTQIIKGGALGYDPVGQKLYNDMHNVFYTTWQAGIKDGKNPAQLSDTESKDYVGNIASTFKRSDAQALADVSQAKPPTTQPEKPKAPPTITEKAQYDALPSGSLYVRDGIERRKP